MQCVAATGLPVAGHTEAWEAGSLSPQGMGMVCDLGPAPFDGEQPHHFTPVGHANMIVLYTCQDTKKLEKPWVRIGGSRSI